MTEAVQAVQAAVALRRVRVDEHFRDFDPLRAGRITPSQFLRCLDQVGVRLSEEQRRHLLETYDTGDGRVNYRKFVQDVYSAFTRQNMEKAPTDRPPTPDKTATIAKPRFEYDNQEMEDMYHELKEIIRRHCQTYGMSVRQAFQEFDRVNRGLVTLAQFQRNLPAPKDFEPFHVRVIANRFLQDGNLVNYLAFHREVEGITMEQPLGFRHTLKRNEVSDAPGAGTLRSANADEIVQQLQVAFHRTRVRPIEFMRDYDKLNSSCITANQFECGLSLACSAPGGVRLTREQINALVEKYRVKDGRVNYRQFCKDTDEAFRTGKTDDLTRDPLAAVPERTRRDVVRDENDLDPGQEERLATVLDAIRRHVDERNLDLYPQFRDFDRRNGFTKGVTRAQFRRLLDLTLSLPLHDNDVGLICDKYANPATGHVNYHKFIADVDEDSNLKPRDNLYFDKATIAGFKTLKDAEAEKKEQVADLNEAVALLKLKVVERSLRAAEYLRDFDRLRKGRITPSQFKSGVKTMLPELSEAHLNALVVAYTDESAPAPTTIAWRRFASDMDDLLFPTRNLEKAPRTATRDGRDVVREVQSATQTPPEAKGFDQQALEEVDEALESIRYQVHKQKLELKDNLKDFDRHNRGQVTPQQFAQALDMSRVVLAPRQVRLLQVYYEKERLIAYRSFLNDIQPPSASANLTQDTMRGVKEVEQRRQQFREKDDGADVEETLEKIKLVVAQRRVRILEHMRGFDKLRKGRVTTRAFRSALSMCNLDLSLPEFRALESEYEAEGMPDHVNYVRFCRDVDAVFGTTDLHREPTKESQQFIPPMDIEVQANTRKLASEEKETAENLLRSIARVADERGASMEDDFKDFDRVNRGSVTRSQFQRVLADLRLCEGARQSEIDALMNLFRVRVGGQENVHYRRFLAEVENICEQDHGARAAGKA